jgi:general secretion pathway protein B
MSYVLEALKKAQAQREQGGIPGIHSLQVPYVAVEGKPRNNLKPVLWVITGLLVIILGLFAWRMGGNLWMLQNRAAAVTQVPSTPEITPARAAAPAQISRPVSETLSEGEVQVTGLAASESVTPKRKEKAAPPTSKAPAAVPTPVPKPEPKPEPKVQSKDAVHKIYAVTELPEGVRRELPTLVISGGSYSSNPAQRLIIVNNQVFTESSQPAPGVVVERIEQNAAVLSFQGYSYRVGY